MIDNESIDTDSTAPLEKPDRKHGEERTPAQKLTRLGIAHFLAVIFMLSMWAAADTWLLVTDLGLAKFLSVTTAAVAGITVGFVIHEWCHFAGAKLSGSSYSVPDKPSFMVFNFDFDKNTLTQFNIMTLGGQVGSLLAVLGLWWLVPVDNLGRAMLIAAAIGFAVLSGAFEWPILVRTQRSKNPQQELSGITAKSARQNTGLGIATAMVVWWLIA